MTNKQIARVLKETADLIEISGGNAFRARAFSSGARALERLEMPVVTLLAEDRLTAVSGIGSGLAAQIREFVETGTLALRDELLAALPPGLPALLRVKGLGSKRVRQIWQDLDVSTLDELEHAAEAGRLAELEGFGKKTQATILANLALLKRYAGRRHFADAYLQALPLLDRLRNTEGVARAELAGPLRRRMETVEAVDAVVAADDPATVEAALAGWLRGGEATKLDGDTLLEGALPDGLPLRVRVTAPDRYGTALWRATGAEAHLDAFEQEYGSPDAHADEARVYEAAGLPFIAPELREGSGELEAAAENELPELLTVEDLRGTLHNHSTYSDGAHTVREMAEAARAMGLSYFGLCDHSRSLTIAKGMSIERVLAQHEEVEALNDEFAHDGGPPFRIFAGVESDILADGALDYPDEILAAFDFIVASVHSGFNMAEAAATERIIRAVENPYTSILGHPTGRLLLRREGYPIDHAAILDACAAHGVAVEINANPWRLDLDWRWVHEATRRGILVAINPDAHSTEELHNVRWGVEVARKGWLTAAQCLNAKSLDAFTGWLDARRLERVA